mmetsp:Transcript_37944/g.122065  ORF Transcript_37944/g.122065 Transcript_37944/m.122065 type:complete len:182 (+) Transcript_37944:118-663(+)
MASSSSYCVTTGGKVNHFVRITLEALQSTSVQLQAEGPAVSKAVTVAEIAKRRLRGVHQSTQIGISGPAGDGRRPRPRISITLSLSQLNPKQPGYQRPLTDDEFALALELEAEQAHLACAADGGGDALMADTFAAEEPPVAGVDAPLTPAAQRVVVGDGSTGAEGGPVGNERDNVCCNSSS